MNFRPIVLLPVLTLLIGCASTQSPKVAVCDGKHRRPANPYGTVLPSVQLAGQGAATTPPAIKPLTGSTAPGPLSAIDPRSLLPCGRSV
jgi:tRNA A37 threonylcarbamoyladenosine synthetase subunit TsaC/SUA5/YrdC